MECIARHRTMKGSAPFVAIGNPGTDIIVWMRSFGTLPVSDTDTRVSCLKGLRRPESRRPRARVLCSCRYPSCRNCLIPQAYVMRSFGPSARRRGLGRYRRTYVVGYHHTQWSYIKVFSTATQTSNTRKVNRCEVALRRRQPDERDGGPYDGREGTALRRNHQRCRGVFGFEILPRGDPPPGSSCPIYSSLILRQIIVQKR